jgi:hypothetical protein
MLGVSYREHSPCSCSHPIVVSEDAVRRMITNFRRCLGTSLSASSIGRPLKTPARSRWRCTSPEFCLIVNIRALFSPNNARRAMDFSVLPISTNRLGAAHRDGVYHLGDLKPIRFKESGFAASRVKAEPMAASLHNEDGLRL